MLLDSDRFLGAFPDVSAVVIGIGLFALTALTSATDSRGKWKYVPIIASAFVIAVLRYLRIVPPVPEVSPASVASFLLLGLLTFCFIVDIRSLDKWMRRGNRPSNKAVLSAMMLIAGLLVATWVIYVEETAFIFRADWQAARILEKNHRGSH